jgi:hypothetical protein
MHLSEEFIEKYKKIHEKEYGEKLTSEEAYESAHNLLGFFEVLYKCAMREDGHKRRLGKEPKGFALEGSFYSCPICGCNTPGPEMWYDKHGQKCIICQKAIDKKIIPGSLCKNDKEFYKMWEIERWYNLKAQTIKKLVREGKLKARIINRVDGKPHCYIFIIKDNSGVLRPKPEGRMVQLDENKFTMEYPDYDEKKFKI